MGTPLVVGPIVIDGSPAVKQITDQGKSRLAPSPRLLDRVREAIRLRHYSLRTEEAYVQWAKRFILFHGKRHPESMGAGELAP